MRFLSDGDWLFLNNLILQVNSIENDPEFRRRILMEIRKMIPYDAAVFCLTDTSKIVEGSPWRASTRFIDPVSIDAPLDKVVEYTEQYYEQDPLTSKNLPKKSGVYLEREFMNEEDIQSEYFARHLGESDVLSCVFFYNEINLGFLCLHRFKGSQKFTDFDALVMEIIEPHITNRLAKWRVKSKTTSEESLFLKRYNITSREADVIRCVMKGKKNTEIADELIVSVSTVKKHLESIFSKTNCKSRFELISLLQHHTAKGNM